MMGLLYLDPTLFELILGGLALDVFFFFKYTSILLGLPTHSFIYLFGYAGSWLQDMVSLHWVAHRL